MDRRQGNRAGAAKIEAGGRAPKTDPDPACACAKCLEKLLFQR
jgi:hypothetical protein